MHIPPIKLHKQAETTYRYPFLAVNKQAVYSIPPSLRPSLSPQQYNRIPATEPRQKKKRYAQHPKFIPSFIVVHASRYRRTIKRRPRRGFLPSSWPITFRRAVRGTTLRWNGETRRWGKQILRERLMQLGHAGRPLRRWMGGAGGWSKIGQPWSERRE